MLVLVVFYQSNSFASMKKFLLLFSVFITHGMFAQNRDSLLQVISKGIKDTNTVKAYRILAGISDASKTREALLFGFKGAELGKVLDWPKGVAGSYLNIGSQYNFLGKLDSALMYADSAIKYSHLAGDPRRLSLIYLNKADYYRQLDLFTKTLAYCDTSMKYAQEAKSDDTKARIFQTMGSVYFSQAINDKALYYYDQANVLYQLLGNEKMYAIVICNMGNVYDNLNNYDSSIAYYKKAIEIGERLNDNNQLPLYYGSLGETLYNAGRLDEALIYCRKALALAEDAGSSVHISIGYLRLSELFFMKKDYRQAIHYASLGYDFAKENEYLEDQQLAAETLADAYNKTGDYKNAFVFSKINKTLTDSLNKIKFEGETITRQTVFEVSQKENQIQLLNNEKALQQKEIQQKTLFISLLILALVAIIIIALVLRNRYTLKQRLKEVELRNKIASDLHDDVGSTLSSIRMYSDIVKSQPEQNANAVTLLDKISSNSKEMIENMSDIVWMIKPGNDEFKNIENRMLNFANEICAPSGISFDFIKNANAEEIKMPMEQRRDLYLIFKEAVNNAVKYAGCRSITAQINFEKPLLHLSISDNGSGFNASIIKAGNGLANMKLRTERNGGKFSVDSAQGEGTEIKISFAVQ